MTLVALKSGPQVAAKLGNPAGLLYRRICYSVRKSGVLGITEYRQGAPWPLPKFASVRLAPKVGLKFTIILILGVVNNVRHILCCGFSIGALICKDG